MKASTLVIASALAAASSMSGCALDPAVAQRATAIAVGGNAVTPEQITISNSRLPQETPDDTIRWHASAPNGEFDCSALPTDSGGLKQTLCVKK